MLGRRSVLFGLPLVVAGCGGQTVWAPDASLARARYRHDGAPVLTLYTSLNNDTLGGAHTGLLINAAERVMFDPAGSFTSPDVPERNDVLYGLTPAAEEAYSRYQSSPGYHLIKQHIPVSAEVAAQALAAAQLAGPVGKSYCTRATASLLRDLPGFGDLRVSWFPDNLMKQVAALPGVTAEFVYPVDDGYRDAAQAAFARDILSLPTAVSQ